MKENKDLSISYYTRSLDGHRQSYLDFIKSKLGGDRVYGKSLLTNKGPIFFLMIEENFLLYFFVSFIRAILGKKTLGLLFRPKPALEADKVRLKLKLILLKILKKNRNIQTISIVPVPLEPKISEIVDGWIYDFQLWDITKEEKDIFEKIKVHNFNFKNSEKYLIANIDEIKFTNKKILIALGSQNKNKGINILYDNIDQITKNYLVIVAGRFDLESVQYKKKLEKNNVLIFDRFMSDEEILALYAIADAAWCYYDPLYDQASGILGRAVQLNIIPIVRPNSFSEKFCKIKNIKYLACEPLKIANGLEKIANQQDIDKKINLLDFEKVSLTQLYLSLSIDKDKQSV